MKQEFDWRDYDNYDEWLHSVLETLTENIEEKDKEIERLKLHIMKIKEAISTWNIENDEGHNDFKIPNKIIDIVWSDN